MEYRQPHTVKKFQAISLPGLTLDTLGLYFAALGLLRLVSRKWPQVRGCWRNGAFSIIGDDITNDRVFRYLLSLKKDDLIAFEITWEKDAKESRRNQSSKAFYGDNPALPLLIHRSQCDENRLTTFDMHVVANKKVAGNPIFKNPGGKRKPHDHWSRVVGDALGEMSGKSSLKAALYGDFSDNPKLDKWNVGTWFPSANKIYNFEGSSLRTNLSVHTENGICSWLVLLAVNGFLFLAGSTSRKLGVNSRGIATYPFTTTAAGPLSKDECGKSEAEFWAPVWNKPLTKSEIDVLFSRSKSEVGSQSATASSAFAAAVISRGVDHGLTEFRRFEFRYSTGDKTFEAVQSARVQIRSDQRPIISRSLQRIISLRDSLPKDRKLSGKWRFEGLQGPLDRDLLELAQVVGKGDPERQFEAVLSVLDAAVTALTKVDRNKANREAKVSFERLPLDLLAWLVENEGGSPEFRIALAIASLKGEVPAKVKMPGEQSRFPQPFLAYRLGATGRGRFWSLPKDRPLRAVWSPRNLVDNLCMLARRRLIESPSSAMAPFRSNYPAPLTDVLAFLQGRTDDLLLTQWLDRLSLFNWLDHTENQRKLHKARATKKDAFPFWSADAALYAYFRPLVHDDLLRGLQEQAGGPRTRGKNEPILATASRLAPVLAALEREDSATAWNLAKSAFHAECVSIADFGPDPKFASDDPKRLLAALIIPASTNGLYGYFHQHWQAPSQPKLNNAVN